MKNIFNILLNELDNYIQKKNIDVLKKNLNKNLALYVDVGSHYGEMIKTISNEFNVKKIFAFEPNPACISSLKNLNQNNVKIFQTALGEKNGFAQLNIGYISSMSTINNLNYESFYTKIKKLVIRLFYLRNTIYRNKIKVKKSLLFNILKKNKVKKIDLIKIDTEGHEFNVLKGLRNYIKKTNIVLLEYHYDDSLIKNYNFEKLNLFFVKNNFKLISKNKMLLRKGFELIYKNSKNY